MAENKYIDMHYSTPEEIYHRRIKATIPDDLPEKVLEAVKEHRGKDNRISRIHLVNKVFGLKLPENTSLANLSEDRQVRETIEVLQKQYPILASSGMGGYYYADSIDEINRYVSEIDSRAQKLLDKSRNLRRIALSEFGKSTQLALI